MTENHHQSQRGSQRQWDTAVHRNSVGTYMYLVISKALLDFIQQAAVIELTECGQVIAGGRRHELDLWGGAMAKLISVSHFLISSSRAHVPT